MQCRWKKLDTVLRLFWRICSAAARRKQPCGDASFMRDYREEEDIRSGSTVNLKAICRNV
jgi:hypothetical protein